MEDNESYVEMFIIIQVWEIIGVLVLILYGWVVK